MVYGHVYTIGHVYHEATLIKYKIVLAIVYYIY
jgi:hypothetical protein